MKMPEITVFGGIPEESFPTTAQNTRTTKMLMQEWQLGPVKTSIRPGDNKAFWDKLARSWEVDSKEARRRFCANCEYFQNGPEWQAKMEAIPLNALDEDGGGRGFCERFDFICHNLRVCQAWEPRECEGED
jgi:hypothetical protein